MQDNQDVELLARQLEAHPDFRVIRRLPIKDAYHAPEGKALLKGIILDTETTGLDLKSDRVIELAMILFEYDPDSGRAYRILEVFGELENPGTPIPPRSSAVHGITDEMVQGKVFDDQEVARVASDVAIVIAHNARFDRPMIEKRYPLFENLPWACSFQEVAWKDEGFVSGGLESLSLQSGFFYDAHRAEMDCRALLELLQRTGEDNAPFLKRLIRRSGEKDIRFWPLESPFESKDIQKARGYRWDSDRRAWNSAVAQADLPQEVAWLRDNVYEKRPFSLELEKTDAFNRFSARRGETEQVLY
jgi:DNA polymerase-3 subunit epsilon